MLRQVIHLLESRNTKGEATVHTTTVIGRNQCDHMHGRVVTELGELPRFRRTIDPRSTTRGVISTSIIIQSVLSFLYSQFVTARLRFRPGHRTAGEGDHTYSKHFLNQSLILNRD
jgi:hypothetical protein